MTACQKWNDCLLDFALGALSATAVREVEKHLESCPACSAALVELRARRQRMDAALRQLAQGPEPSPAFHARLLSALESRPAPLAWRPAWAGVGAGVVVLALVVLLLDRWAGRWDDLIQPDPAWVFARALSGWRSPTEGLLRSPADELLQSAPRLGDVYFPLPPIAPGGDGKKGANDES